MLTYEGQLIRTREVAVGNAEHLDAVPFDRRNFTWSAANSRVSRDDDEAMGAGGLQPLLVFHRLGALFAIERRECLHFEAVGLHSLGNDVPPHAAIEQEARSPKRRARARHE